MHRRIVGNGLDIEVRLTVWSSPPKTVVSSVLAVVASPASRRLCQPTELSCGWTERPLRGWPCIDCFHLMFSRARAATCDTKGKDISASVANSSWAKCPAQTLSSAISDRALELSPCLRICINRLIAAEIGPTKVRLGTTKSARWRDWPFWRPTDVECRRGC